MTDINRRKFLAGTSVALGTLALSASPLASAASSFLHSNAPITVGQIMDLFIKSVPGGAKGTTVDTLKSGSRDIVVSGIVTSSFANIAVIRKAIALGANFIIAHEPTFYNHLDETGWLEKDEVYQYKAALLKEHGIAVWRNHDYIHTITPDGVLEGVVAKLGWQQFGKAGQPVFQLSPPRTLKALIGETKKKLNIGMVRYIGNLDQRCQKVLFLPGAPGGKLQIAMAGEEKPDVLICGEISEWETAEYVRDAEAKGDKLALIVLGHSVSEEAGSDYMENWLSRNVPGIKTTHITAGNPLSFM
jgi:putative NIF3 family GTP cyclohydrolase 1 type 2